MKTITLSLSSLDEARRRTAAAFHNEKQATRISFASAELLWKVLTTKRWELLRVMAGQSAMTIREAARRVKRDVKAVHGDVHALLDAGVLERDSRGRILFPYDAVHVDFLLHAA